MASTIFSNPTVSTDPRVAELLRKLGVPTHLNGYHYLKYGIDTAIKNPDVLVSLTKNFYPTIGEHFDTTGGCVERGIRNAIEVAIGRTDINAYVSVFGNVVYSEITLTCSEFVAGCIEYLNTHPDPDPPASIIEPGNLKAALEKINSIQSELDDLAAMLESFNC